MEATNSYFTVDQIAEMYHVRGCDVCCDQCRFCNAPTIDRDAQICYCVYWKQRMKCGTFCNHYMPKVANGK